MKLGKIDWELIKELPDNTMIKVTVGNLKKFIQLTQRK